MGQMQNFKILRSICDDLSSLCQFHRYDNQSPNSIMVLRNPLHAFFVILNYGALKTIHAICRALYTIIAIDILVLTDRQTKFIY